MDARNTGALIAARRKALGLTQKQLAERLLVSDKAVSKWENGASYPEVTLLPPLAQLLGITVDELLAGEVRGEEQAAGSTEAADAPEDGDSPQGKPGAPPLEAFLTPQQYLADRQGSTDDKMLLAAVVCILAAAYCGSLFGQAAVLRNLVIVLIVYVAFRVWHSKQCDRFAALGLDTAVSRRRAHMADRLFGIVWVFELLVWWLVKRLGWLLFDYELNKIDRYYIVFSAGDVNINSHQPWLLFYAMASVPLFFALVGVFAVAYRRMKPETRFRPLAVVLPALPALVGAVVVAWQRVQTALAGMPDYSTDPRTMLIQRDELEEALQTAGQGALNGAVIVIAVLVVVLLVLWRVTHGRVPLVSVILLAVYAAIWLPSGALWLDIGYEGFAQQPYAVEDITIQLGGLVTLLMLTALCTGIALFAGSLRRKKV